MQLNALVYFQCEKSGPAVACTKGNRSCYTDLSKKAGMFSAIKFRRFHFLSHLTALIRGLHIEVSRTKARPSSPFLPMFVN